MAVLGCCAVSDVRRHRIPNVWIVAGFAAGIMCACVDAWTGKGFTAAGFTARMALVCAIGFPFFVLRMTGAGDIKVMGLIAAFLGIQDGILAIGAGLCLGAVLALGKMLHHGSIYQRFSYLSAYVRRVIQTRKMEVYYDPGRDGYDPVIPLGACLFAGTLFTILWKG